MQFISPHEFHCWVTDSAFRNQVSETVSETIHSSLHQHMLKLLRTVLQLLQLYPYYYRRWISTTTAGAGSVLPLLGLDQYYHYWVWISTTTTGAGSVN